MKTLLLEIASKGFIYRQVWREENVAVYSQHSSPDAKPQAYETIIIKSHNGYTIAGAYVAPAEMYPSDGLFGKMAWSYSTHLHSPEQALKIALDKGTQVLHDERIKAQSKST